VAQLVSAVANDSANSLESLLLMTLLLHDPITRATLMPQAAADSTCARKAQETVNLSENTPGSTQMNEANYKLNPMNMKKKIRCGLAAMTLCSCATGWNPDVQAHRNAERLIAEGRGSAWNPDVQMYRNANRF
jgi:hypothetical protein